MNEIIRSIESVQLKNDIPQFASADTVRVQVKVVEGSLDRLQAFEGVVIARRNGSVRETFTVRRTSYGVGVERTFPLHSPRVDSIKVVRRGKVRRAKLYYLRERSGKAAKVKERTESHGPLTGSASVAMPVYSLKGTSPCPTIASTGIPATWQGPGGCCRTSFGPWTR